MQFAKNLGMSLLGVWLIVDGLIGLLGLSFQGLGMLMAIPGPRCRHLDPHGALASERGDLGCAGARTQSRRRSDRASLPTPWIITDENRIQERQAHEIQPRLTLHHSALVLRLDRSEDRELDPRESRIEPGAPNDIGHIEDAAVVQ